MSYTRIKRITEEERQARAQLKKMGVSEYELQRLYDANYKARQRAEIAGAQYGQSLNLNWKNVLQGARQARQSGKTVSEYINARRAAYKSKYTLKEVKQQNIESITGVENVSDDWGAELVQKTLSRYSAADVVEIKAEAIGEMEDAGEALPPPSDDAYRRAHRRYVENNASTQTEWDSLLRSEQATEVVADETLLEYIAQIIGVNLNAVRRAQAGAEAAAGSMQGDERERYLRRAKKQAFENYGGL